MGTSKDSILTAERARELFRYDPETGKLFWRITTNSRAYAGSEAGCFKGTTGNFYRQVSIGGRRYYAHRLAWLIVTGAWPSEELDHINGDGLNNRWHNLREVQHSGNLRNAKRQSNNTSGVTGVFWDSECRKWRAGIQVSGTNIHLGRFDTLLAAAEARKAAERRYGFHVNHGRA